MTWSSIKCVTEDIYEVARICNITLPTHLASGGPSGNGGQHVYHPGWKKVYLIFFFFVFFSSHFLAVVLGTATCCRVIRFSCNNHLIVNLPHFMFNISSTLVFVALSTQRRSCYEYVSCTNFNKITSQIRFGTFSNFFYIYSRIIAFLASSLVMHKYVSTLSQPWPQVLAVQIS